MSEPEAKTTDPRLGWHVKLPTISFGGPAAGDLDGDGKLELVFGTYYDEGKVRALNAEDGTTLWIVDAGAPLDASLAIADVVSDSPGPEVLVCSSGLGGFQCLAGGSGKILWKYEFGTGSDSPPAVADLDGDGDLEIVFGSFLHSRVHVLDGATGDVQWVKKLTHTPENYMMEQVQTAPNLVDIDGDGTLEILVATYYVKTPEANQIVALDSEAGEILWSVPVGATIYHGGASADLDGDGRPEFVIGCYDNTLRALNAEDGSLLWAYESDHPIPAPISIADLDGDGELEVFFASGAGIGVLSHTGQVQWTLPASGSFRAGAIADVDGDGGLDVVFGDRRGFLHAKRGADGAEIWTFDATRVHAGPLRIDSGPVLDDFDGDGKLDVFFVGGVPRRSGRAFMLHAGDGLIDNQNRWPMFRHDLQRSGLFRGPWKRKGGGR